MLYIADLQKKKKRAKASSAKDVTLVKTDEGPAVVGYG